MQALSETLTQRPSLLKQTTARSTALRVFGIGEKLTRLLLLAGFAGIDAGRFALGSVLLGLTAAVCVQLMPVDPRAAILAAAVIGLCPLALLILIARHRRERFVKQLPLAIDLLAFSLLSGAGLDRAIQIVGEEMPEPCGSEFRILSVRTSLGQPLAEALGHLNAQYESFEIDLIRSAIDLQSEVGGSLSEILQKTNETLRQRLKLDNNIRSLVGPSQLAAIIMSILPILLVWIFQIARPSYMAPLFRTTTGNCLLLVAITLQAVGCFVMIKLSSSVTTK